MTGGDVSRGGSHPPCSSLFCLVLISYLSIYFISYSILVCIHNYFLTVHISKTLKIEGKPTQIPSQNIKISDP